MNEAAAARGEHGGQERAGDQVGTAQVHGDDLVPRFGARLVNQSVAADDTGVVDDDARCAHRGQDLRGGARDVALGGDVAGHGARVDSGRGDRGSSAREALSRVTEQRDGEAASREGQRRSEANASARAGDDGDLAQPSLP